MAQLITRRQCHIGPESDQILLERIQVAMQSLRLDLLVELLLDEVDQVMKGCISMHKKLWLTVVMHWLAGDRT